MTTVTGIAHIVITYFKQFPTTRPHSRKKSDPTHTKNKSAEADLFFLILGE